MTKAIVDENTTEILRTALRAAQQDWSAEDRLRLVLATNAASATDVSVEQATVHALANYFELAIALANRAGIPLQVLVDTHVQLTTNANSGHDVVIDAGEGRSDSEIALLRLEVDEVKQRLDEIWSDQITERKRTNDLTVETQLLRWFAIEEILLADVPMRRRVPVRMWTQRSTLALDLVLQQVLAKLGFEHEE
jgi:hypothetical protein